MRHPVVAANQLRKLQAHLQVPHLVRHLRHGAVIVEADEQPLQNCLPRPSPLHQALHKRFNEAPLKVIDLSQVAHHSLHPVHPRLALIPTEGVKVATAQSRELGEHLLDDVKLLGQLAGFEVGGEALDVEGVEELHGLFVLVKVQVELVHVVANLLVALDQFELLHGGMGMGLMMVVLVHGHHWRFQGSARRGGGTLQGLGTLLQGVLGGAAMVMMVVVVVEGTPLVIVG